MKFNNIILLFISIVFGISLISCVSSNQGNYYSLTEVPIKTKEVQPKIKEYSEIAASLDEIVLNEKESYNLQDEFLKCTEIIEINVLTDSGKNIGNT